MTKQGINKVIKWVEDELLASRLFVLPGKKELKNDDKYEIVIIDTTETPIQRPSKNQKHFYTGEKSLWLFSLSR